MSLKSLAIGIVAAAFVGGFFVSEVPAREPTCDRRDRLLKTLERKYGEKPIALGLANNGGLVEFLATKDGGTWTIIITLPSGISCFVAAGEDWQANPKHGEGGRT